MQNFYGKTYIMMGFLAISTPLLAMEQQLATTETTELSPATEEARIVKKLLTSCELINNRTLSNESISVAKKSFSRKLKKISLDDIPKVISFIKSNDTLKDNSMLQESLNAELSKKQTDSEEKRILQEKLETEKLEPKKLETKDTYQKWFFATSLTVTCFICLLLLLSNKSPFHHYFAPAT